MAEIGDPEGRPLLAGDGSRLGRIETVYVDPVTDAPQWALVSVGVIGARRTLVPLAQARTLPAGVQVPFARSVVRDAPRVAEDADELSLELERRLLAHYSAAAAPTPAPGPPRAHPPAVDPEIADVPAPGPIEPPAVPVEGELTLLGHRLDVATAHRPNEVVRLRKQVVAQTVVHPVSLRREVLVVEREPIVGAEPGGELVEEVRELTLMREEPVVRKHVVPVERLRIGRAVVTEPVEVREQLLREAAVAEE